MIENREYTNTSSLPSEIWTILYFKQNNGGNPIKTIEREKPFTKENLIGKAPASLTTNFDSGGYRYTFSHWNYSEDIQTQTVNMISIFTSTKLYTWKKYTAKTNSGYRWKQYPGTTTEFTIVSTTSELIPARSKYSSNSTYQSYYMIWHYGPRLGTLGGYASDSSIFSSITLEYDNGYKIKSTWPPSNQSYGANHYCNAGTQTLWILSNSVMISFSSITTVTDKDYDNNRYSYTKVTLDSSSGFQMSDWAYIYAPYLVKYTFGMIYTSEADARQNGFTDSVQIDTYIPGKKTSTSYTYVTSSSSDTYPNPGLSNNGYFYDSREAYTETVRGDYITTVTSTSSTAYPTNSKHTDGYWYIKQ